jgi:exonuclease SbcC
MAKIKQIQIQGFESHLNSIINLSPNLTVVTGSTDSGKTAIIRALRWFAFNDPQGENFLFTLKDLNGNIKKQAEQVSVSITFNDNVTITKTRRNKKTTYKHSNYNSVYEKSELPEELKEKLQLAKHCYNDYETCLNFAYQLDAPFLLSESGSTGAKILGKLAGAEKIDKAISKTTKLIFKEREDKKHNEKLIEQFENNLQDYKGIDELKQKLDICNSLILDLEKNINALNVLANLLKQYKKYDLTLKNIEYKLVSYINLNNIKTTFDCTEGLINSYNKINSLNKDYNLNSSKLKTIDINLLKATKFVELNVVFEGMIKTIESIKQLVKCNTEYKSLNVNLSTIDERLNKISDLHSVIDKVDIVENKNKELKSLVDIETNYNNTNKKYKSYALSESKLKNDILKYETELHTEWDKLGGICPLCESQINSH